MLFSLKHYTFFEWTYKAKRLPFTFQLELGNHLIPILHKLEQVSSDKHIGTMAENLMEALKTNPVVAAKVNITSRVSDIMVGGIDTYGVYKLKQLLSDKHIRTRARLFNR